MPNRIDGRNSIETEFDNFTPHQEFRPSGWRKLFRAVKRRIWALNLCVMFAWAGAGIYLEMTPPVRQTTATVYVQALSTTSEDAVGIVDLQPTIMRSAAVAALAVSRPEIRTLPLLVRVKDPVGFIESHLSVTAEDRPGVYSLSLQSNRPEDAEKLLNALVASYIDFETAQQRQAVDQLQATLREERRKTGADLAAARQHLSDLVKSQSDSNPTVQSRQQAALDRAATAAALAGVREQATDARAAFDKAVQHFGSEDKLKAAAAGMGPVVLSDADLDSIIAQLEQFKQTPPANQAQRHEFNEMQGQYAAAVSQRYDTALHEEDRVQTRFNDLEKQASDADVTDDDYAQLQTQTEQLIALDAQLSDRLSNWDKTQQDQVSITALKPAETAAAVLWPLPWPLIGVATLLGILAGIAAARFLDWARIRLQDEQDACDYAQAGLLGRMQPIPWELTTLGLRGQCVLLRPSDPASHSFEDVRIELEKVLAKHFFRTVLITSTPKAMGKSVLASNLAISMAQSGLKTALVDANYMRPAVNDTFGIDDQVGLSQAIEGSLEVREALHITEMENLEILSVGRADANWSELINQPEFDGVLNQLTERCERVIIDGTTVASDEALIISAFCDATVLLVDPRKGKRREVRAAAERLRRVGAKLVGIVLNEVPKARKPAMPRIPRHEIGDFRALAQPTPTNRDIQVSPEDLDPLAAPVDAVMEADPAEPIEQPAVPQGDAAKENTKESEEAMDVWGLKIESLD